VHSSDLPWVIIHFFFDFRAGRGLANSFEGLLRSFLSQLLENRTLRLLGGSYLEEVLNDQARLRNSILDLLGKADRNFRMFIDGLDEYEGDMLEVLDYLKELHRKLTAPTESGESPKLFKLCLASRDHPTISITLRDSQGFRMQDRNRPGITKYTIYWL
jgi:hypothetical protein